METASLQSNERKLQQFLFNKMHQNQIKRNVCSVSGIKVTNKIWMSLYMHVYLVL